MANLMGGIIFGGIGFVAFVYGKKQSSPKPLCIGLALMIYLYFIPDTAAMYLIGALLCAALYFFRD